MLGIPGETCILIFDCFFYIAIIAVFLGLFWWFKIFLTNTRNFSHSLKSLKDIGSKGIVSECKKWILPESTDEAITKAKSDFKSAFSDYDKKLSPDIFDFLETLYLAGIKRFRLDTNELLDLTISKLFRDNERLRTILSSFVIIGLLGTLAGLAKCLFNASVEGYDEKVIFEHLKFAFLPSLLGVFFTIWFLWLYIRYIKKYVQPLRFELESLTLQNWIPSLYPSEPERIMEGLMDSIKVFKKSSAESGEAVKEVTQNLQEYFRQTENMIRRAAETQDLMGDFNKNIKVSSTAVAHLNTTVEKLKEAVSSIEEGFANKLRDTVNGFSTGVIRLTSFQEEIKETQKLFNDAIGKFTLEVANPMKDQANVSKLTLEELRNYESIFLEYRKKYDQSIEELIKETNTLNKELTDKADTNNEKILAELHTKLTTINQELLQHLSEIIATIEVRNQETAINNEKVYNEFNSKLGALSGTLLERLSVIINTIEDRSRKTAENNEKIFTDLNSSLANSSQNLSVQLKQIIETIEIRLKALEENANSNMAKAANEMRISTERARTLQDNFLKQMENLISEFHKEYKKLTDDYENQIGTLTEQQKEIANFIVTLQKIGEVEKNNLASLQTSFDNLNQNLNTFSTAIGNFGQQVVQINEKLPSVFELQDRLTKVAMFLSKLPDSIIKPEPPRKPGLLIQLFQKIFEIIRSILGMRSHYASR